MEIIRSLVDRQFRFPFSMNKIKWSRERALNGRNCLYFKSAEHTGCAEASVYNYIDKLTEKLVSHDTGNQLEQSSQQFAQSVSYKR